MSKNTTPNKNTNKKDTNSVESPQKEGTPPKSPLPRSPKNTVMVWIVVLVGIATIMYFWDGARADKPVQLQYSQFQALLEQPDSLGVNNLVVLQKAEGRAVLKGSVADKHSLESVVADTQVVVSEKFVANLPFVDGEMISLWQSQGFPYTFKEERQFSEIFVYLVPLLLLLFFFMMIKNMQGGQKGMFSFGKSRAKLQSGENSMVRFADVAGADEAINELAEVIDFLKMPEKYRALGGKIPKGILLLGPPGTGKTLLARAVAGEAQVPFFTMSGSDFVEMFVGVGASRVRDLFENAKKNAPCIIFIDEIDAVGRQRGAGLGGGHDEREQTLNQMLVEMDGFEVNSGVILMAATNRPDVLDPALLRPGRFDRQVVVDIPDVRGREGILKVHTRNVPVAKDVDLQLISKGTPGFSGADLANLVNEAALFAARFNQKEVTMTDFEEARDKIGMGVARQSKVLTENDKKIIAYHEAGHAICHIFCENANPLHKVTIIPRGQALGITWSLPNEDLLHHTRSYVEDQVCIYMGGRVAEKMIFGEMTNGASGDIKGATDIVRKMVCDFGMTDELGPVSYGKGSDQVFIGRELNSHRDYSEKTAELIDTVIKEIVLEQEGRALKLLTEHKQELEYLADALIEHELLDSEEVDKVIRGEKLEFAKKDRMLPEIVEEATGDTQSSDKEVVSTSDTVSQDDSSNDLMEETDGETDKKGDSKE